MYTGVYGFIFFIFIYIASFTSKIVSLHSKETQGLTQGPKEKSPF